MFFNFGLAVICLVCLYFLLSNWYYKAGFKAGHKYGNHEILLTLEALKIVDLKDIQTAIANSKSSGKFQYQDKPEVPVSKE
jgi:hypothetical protein